MTIKYHYTKILSGDNMKKIVLIVLIIVAVISLTIAGLKIKDYNEIKTGTTDEEIREVEKQITEVDQDVEKKRQELEELKESKKDQIEEIEKWQEKTNQIRSYI